MSTLDLPVLERSRPKVSVLDFSLDQHVEKLAKLLRGKADEAWLFGSVAAGGAGPWSDLDVVVVTSSDLPFIERPLEFPEIYELDVTVDLLVYTPEEFNTLLASGGGFWKEFLRTRVRIV